MTDKLLEYVAIKFLHESDERRLYNLVKMNLSQDLDTELKVEWIERPVWLTTDTLDMKEERKEPLWTFSTVKSILRDHDCIVGLAWLMNEQSVESESDDGQQQQNLQAIGQPTIAIKRKRGWPWKV